MILLLPGSVQNSLDLSLKGYSTPSTLAFWTRVIDLLEISLKRMLFNLFISTLSDG